MILYSLVFASSGEHKFLGLSLKKRVIKIFMGNVFISKELQGDGGVN